MSVATSCQTHGAVYSVEIHPQRVQCEVELPMTLDLDDADEEILHNPEVTWFKSRLRYYR